MISTPVSKRTDSMVIPLPIRPPLDRRQLPIRAVSGPRLHKYTFGVNWHRESNARVTMKLCFVKNTIVKLEADQRVSDESLSFALSNRLKGRLNNGV